MTKQTKAQPKSVTVTRMLARGNGATIAEIIKVTNWKEHSCRAFLTGVRKKIPLLKEQRPDGKIAYRLQAQPAQGVPE